MGAFVGLAGKALKAVLKIALFCGLCMVFNSIRGVACNRVNHGKIFRTSPRDEYGLQYTMVYVLWVCAFNTYT